MADIALALALTLLAGTLVGHVLHWCLHQRWSRSFYRSHMVHHLKCYPPGDLRSAAYRSAGTSNSAVLFAVPIAVLLALVSWAMIAAGASPSSIAAVLGSAALVGFAHDYVHDAFHIEMHWLERAPGFLRLRAYHDAHHLDLRRNLGILWLGWDRLFGSFTEGK